MPASLREVLTRKEDEAAPAPAQVARLHRDLLAWYAACRRDLPWRRTRDPWAIWVSEIMLQQTRVETVKPYFERFIARFPTPLALAEAPEDDVLSAWSGLGYYRRARMLHAGAKAVAARGDEGIPSDREGLRALPGVGSYTSGAIASIAFGRAVGLVDGNVARVLSRLFLIEDDMKRGGMRRAERLAETLVPPQTPGDWNQALMELGATICAPRSPACGRCPVAPSCRALAEGRVDALPVIGEKTKPKPQRVQALVARTKDGKVLLARRRSSGLFGGLWEPPAIDGDEAARQTLVGTLMLDGLTAVGRVVHVLSHRRLTVDVHVATLVRAPDVASLPDAYEAVGVYDDAALAGLGVSTLARKVLAAASADLGPLFGERSGAPEVGAARSAPATSPTRRKRAARRSS